MNATDRPTLDEMIALLTARLGPPRKVEGEGCTRIAWWGVEYGKPGGAVDVTQNDGGLRVCAKREMDPYATIWIGTARKMAAFELRGKPSPVLTAEIAVEVAALAMGVL